MDSNQNLILLNNETIKSNALSDLKTPFVIGNEYTYPNDIWFPIVKELIVTIPIPEGFQVIPGEEVQIETSFDQHNLSAVVIKEAVPVDLNFVDESSNIVNMDKTVDIYLIKLVGNLYYNTVAKNFEPIVTNFWRRSTLFNTFGGIVLNDRLGYVSDLSHVPPNIEENLTYNIIIHSINSNPDNRNSTRAGAANTQYYITVSITIVINYNQGPIS